MKNSKQVTGYRIMEHPNGIFSLLFNTKDRWVFFHKFNDETYQIGGSAEGKDDEEDQKYIQEIPEGLIPDESFLTLTTQSKDCISFYFVPVKMILEGKVIHASGELK